jgi:hypothetical protein
MPMHLSHHHHYDSDVALASTYKSIQRSSVISLFFVASSIPLILSLSAAVTEALVGALSG